MKDGKLKRDEFRLSLRSLQRQQDALDALDSAWRASLREKVRPNDFVLGSVFLTREFF